MSRGGNTDSVLIRLLNEDSRDAFTEIYDRYWERMYIVALHKLNNPHDAEDIVQEIFVDIWNRRFVLTITSTLHGYLATAVKYRVINKLAKRNKNVSQELPNEEIGDLANHNNWIDFLDFEKQLDQTVMSLPEKCRLVFRMSRGEGLTQKQIAEKLDIAEKTVESHLSKALKTLRSAFQSFFSTFF